MYQPSNFTFEYGYFTLKLQKFLSPYVVFSPNGSQIICFHYLKQFEHKVTVYDQNYYKIGGKRTNPKQAMFMSFIRLISFF
jgi:hypothetical protein